MNRVAVEYLGQVVSPCVIIRSFGPFVRVVMPVKGGDYWIRWVPKWKVVNHD